ncbi:MAG: hypothetical protein ABI383_01080 [Acidobacteriaceae bacterium]
MSIWDDIELPDYEREPDEDLSDEFDDAFLDAACEQLIKFLDGSPDGVFYQQQLEVIFEKNFFHWVTAKALKILREAQQVGSESQTLRTSEP